MVDVFFFYSASGKQITTLSHENVSKSEWRPHVLWWVTYTLPGIMVSQGAESFRFTVYQLVCASLIENIL